MLWRRVGAAGRGRAARSGLLCTAEGTVGLPGRPSLVVPLPVLRRQVGFVGRWRASRADAEAVVLVDRLGPGIWEYAGPLCGLLAAAGSVGWLPTRGCVCSACRLGWAAAASCVCEVGGDCEVAAARATPVELFAGGLCCPAVAAGSCVCPVRRNVCCCCAPRL